MSIENESTLAYQEWRTKLGFDNQGDTIEFVLEMFYRVGYAQGKIAGLKWRPARKWWQLW